MMVGQSVARLGKRAFWLVVAYASLGLALAGIVVPVLPTTPFALLAAYAGARGSARLHERLLAHRVLGPVIRDWQAGRAVRRRPKQAASATMAVSAAILFVASPSLWLAIAVTALMASVALWLWRRPEPPL